MRDRMASFRKKEIWIVGSNLNMGRFSLSKILKVSYIFTDPVKILYVAELIQVCKK